LALAPRQERLAWVDTARGIGIILVVYGHALRGHMVSGAYDPAWHADIQDDVIYAFHMPLFFFLAGLFAQRSLAKGTMAFVRDKGLTLAYPYFLWSFVSIVLGMAAASAVNNAPQVNAIIELWRTPVYQYWFLYALLICQLVMLATRADWRITVLLCGLSAIFGGVSGLGMITIAFGFYVYFGLGILLASKAADFHFPPAALAGAALALVAAFGATYVIGDDLPLRLVIVARALLGSAAVVALAMLLAPHTRWLTVLGTASMAIYVLHTIFSAGLRMALHAIGYSNNVVALVLGTMIGLGAPVLVWWFARHYGALPWFGLGAQPRAAQGQMS
jgi:fucose 4-O-acetylase-like acetyltransferase